MTLESGWLMLGAIATVWTLLTVAAAVFVSAEDDAFVMVGGAIGVILWLAWSWASLDVTVVGDSLSTTSVSNPILSVSGVMLALVPAYFVLVGPLNLIQRRYREADQTDL